MASGQNVLPMPLHVTALICSTIPVHELHQLDPPCRSYHPHVDMHESTNPSSTPRDTIRKESILRQEAIWRQDGIGSPFSRQKKSFAATDQILSKKRPISITCGKQFVRIVLNDGTLVDYMLSGNSYRATPLEWQDARIDSSVASYISQSAPASCSCACFNENGTLLVLGLESPCRLIALHNRLQCKDNDNKINDSSQFVPSSNRAIRHAAAAVAYADQNERKSRFIHVNPSNTLICVVYARSFAIFDLHQASNYSSTSTTTALQIELKYQRPTDDWKIVFSQWHSHISNTLLVAMEKDQILRLVEWRIDDELTQNDNSKLEVSLSASATCIEPDCSWTKLIVSCKDSTFITIDMNCKDDDDDNRYVESNRRMICGHNEPVLVKWYPHGTFFVTFFENGDVMLMDRALQCIGFIDYYKAYDEKHCIKLTDSFQYFARVLCGVWGDSPPGTSSIDSNCLAVVFDRGPLVVFRIEIASLFGSGVITGMHLISERVRCHLFDEAIALLNHMDKNEFNYSRAFHLILSALLRIPHDEVMQSHQTNSTQVALLYFFNHIHAQIPQDDTLIMIARKLINRLIRVGLHELAWNVCMQFDGHNNEWLRDIASFTQFIGKHSLSRLAYQSIQGEFVQKQLGERMTEKDVNGTMELYNLEDERINDMIHAPSIPMPNHLQPSLHVIKRIAMQLESCSRFDDALRLYDKYGLANEKMHLQSIVDALALESASLPRKDA